MTIAASGALRASAIRTEYGGGTVMRLGNYRRGHASGLVKGKAANNNAVNMSAAVGATVLRMSQFRGQAKGYTYTNTTTRVPSPAHYHCHVEFGDDWTGNTWPCFYINNAQMGSSSTSYYALVIWGRDVGPFTFTNNNNIDGAGGAANSGVGQAAIYIYNTVAGANRPIINNAAGGRIRGGGGGGGQGGTGGTGGAGTYMVYEPGPTVSQHSYARDAYMWRLGSDGTFYLMWGGAGLHYGANPGNPVVFGSIAYGTNYTKQESYSVSGVNYDSYPIRRNYSTTTGAGGAGGAGGNGGRGQGYNQTLASGSNGAAGGAGAVSPSGAGGAGGLGGAGGNWGLGGGTGNGGASGVGGLGGGGLPGPTAGAAGAAGGAAGAAISAASPYGFNFGGTYNGALAGTTPT